MHNVVFIMLLSACMCLCVCMCVCVHVLTEIYIALYESVSAYMYVKRFS